MANKRRPDCGGAKFGGFGDRVCGCSALSVLDPANGCSAVISVQVLPDNATPFATIALPDTLTCAAGSILLPGDGSVGSDFTYFWSGAGLLSGGAALTPLVNAPGVYSLLVTNTANGCTAQVFVNVAANTAVPTVSITQSHLLTCTISSVTLLADVQTSGFIFNWATTNGNILTGNNAHP